MKKLSICIPTYNRANFLRRLLDTCIKESAGIEEFVEVCISDNGSTDETKKVLKTYANKSKIIKYKLNSENKGFDSNLISVLSMAKGEYCWMLGDDDILMEHAVKDIIEIIDKNRPDFIICEFSSNFNYKHIRWEGDSEIKNQVEIREVFLQKFSQLAFLSSNIIRRKIFLELKKELPEEGEGFVHSLIQFYALKYIKKLYITKKIEVFDTSEGIVPTKKTQIQIYFKLGKIINKLLDMNKISITEHQSLLNKIYSFFFLRLIFYHFAIKDDGCNRKELTRMEREIYENFIRKTVNDGIKIRASFFIINNKFLLWLFRTGYLLIYVKLMNVFRKNKKQVAWEFWNKNKKLGGRRTYF
ncbi:MAG: glycosyltransferase family 2 protein [Candidatus Woesearchaeota archaeon]